MDPSETVLILDLCRGDDDPGAESLNFDALTEFRGSFAGSCFLLCCEDCEDGDFAMVELALAAILFCLSIFKASSLFRSSSSCNTNNMNIHRRPFGNAKNASWQKKHYIVIIRTRSKS